MVDLSKLGTLKMKLVAEDKFEPIWEYFLDNFGEVEGFLDLGERIPVGDQLRMAILLPAVVALSKNNILPDENGPQPEIVAVSLADEHFIHGTVFIQGHIGAYFYFEDLDVGMLCFTIMGAETVFSRVSVRPDRARGPHRA